MHISMPYTINNQSIHPLFVTTIFLLLLLLLRTLIIIIAAVPIFAFFLILLGSFHFDFHLGFRVRGGIIIVALETAQTRRQGARGERRERERESVCVCVCMCVEREDLHILFTITALAGIAFEIRVVLATSLIVIIDTGNRSIIKFGIIGGRATLELLLCLYCLEVLDTKFFVLYKGK
eukprot:TRINITY_DN124_c0_g1_i8.p1 TRINITY_DN124_c0_g1~~TRINITY_DN124_c0_g1_i8.p1  ORF type:complete len:178 (-),score=8.77 TRINITY_DN124_c0_g1_i8:43-576(-)